MTRTTGLAAGAAVLLLAAGAARAGAPMVMGAGPADARPGDCYEKVRVEEVWQTTPERQLVAPEHVEHRLIPAEYAWRDRQVVTRPARVEHYTVPPTYRAEIYTEVVRPATYRTEVIPAVYDAVPRQVLVREARSLWKPAYAQPVYGNCAPQGCAGGYDGRPPYAQGGYGQPGYGPPGWSGQTQVTPTGEILCLVFEPAVYRTVMEQVVREPEHAVQIPVPAETRQVTRQVIDRPAYDATHEIPAEYGTEPEQVLVRPARDEAYTVPAVYRTVDSRRLVSPARYEWRHSACKAPPAEPPPPAPLPPAPPVIHEPLPCATCMPGPHMGPHMGPPPGPGAMGPRVHHRWEMAREGRPMTVARAPEPPPAMDRPDMGGRPMVARVQAALAGRGYYRGPTDGVFTEPTRDALVRFQQSKGFAADGQLTRETARELGLGR